MGGRRRYAVIVTREEAYWVAVVDGVRGGATESRRLAALEDEVRDLLAGLLDVDEQAFELDWDFTSALGADAVDRLEHYRRVRNKLVHAQHDYESAQLKAVHVLRVGGVSLRDAAALLDVSHQRVQQLESAH